MRRVTDDDHAAAVPRRDTRQIVGVVGPQLQLSRPHQLRPRTGVAVEEVGGFVRRSRSETDRRAVLVEMTEHGHARTWAADGPLVEAGRPMLDELSVDQLRYLGDYLRRITELTDTQRAVLEQRDLHDPRARQSGDGAAGS